MRIRNVKNKEEILSSCDFVINNPAINRGNWSSLFKKDNPIYLEIGTGKCHFIYNMALQNPNINFIGVEKNASVLALSVKELKKLDNLLLVNYDAQFLGDIFFKEINKIFLNFSDPWPKARHEKRRLTSSAFLKQYDNIFLDNLNNDEKKEIILKTDNQSFFEYSIVSLSNNGYIINDISLDLHKLKNNDNIMTEYEHKFSDLGCKIYMLRAYKK